VTVATSSDWRRRGWRVRASKWTGIASLLLAAVGHAHAGSITGVVSHVHVRASDGLVYVVVSGSPVGKPTCATGNYWMIANENSNVGKQQLALLTAAKSSGQVVTITGSGTCTRWGDGEDINSVQLQ
jgi:hypothetical protein